MENMLHMGHMPTSLLETLEREIGSLKLTEAFSWEDASGRQRKTFEFGVIFREIERTGQMVRTPVPAWLAQARTHLVALFQAHLSEKDPEKYENCIITIYRAGDGIKRHTDRAYFGPDVLGIIVQPDQAADPAHPPAALTFCKPRSAEVVALPEHKGMAFLFQGALRQTWEHELSPVHTGRIAVQFRTVLDDKIRQNSHWNYLPT